MVDIDMPASSTPRSALLHRSGRDNIRYGSSGGSDAAIELGRLRFL